MALVHRAIGGENRHDIKKYRIPINIPERIEVLANHPSDLISDVINIILKNEVAEI